MGATASRSLPTNKTTCLVRISNYSKLVRVPVLHQQTLDIIFFGGISWEVAVEPRGFSEGLADDIQVLVVPRYRGLDLVLKGIDISIEVLDETGEGTVFHQESNGVLEVHRMLILGMSRRSLEASSCVHNDGFTVRCTLSKQPAANWWCLLFSKPKEVAAVLEPPQVAMAGSNTLTIDSFSKIKATLQNQGCAHSTHFAVGGSRWYFKFSPAGYLVIVRASNDEAPTMAEFSFELEGVVSFCQDPTLYLMN